MRSTFRSSLALGLAWLAIGAPGAAEAAERHHPELFYFTAAPDRFGPRNLYVTDGQPEGTRTVLSSNKAGYEPSVEDHDLAGGRILVRQGPRSNSAVSPSGYLLSVGAGGDLTPITSNFQLQHALEVRILGEVAGNLYLKAEGRAGFSIVRTDGTAAGTVTVALTRDSAAAAAGIAKARYLAEVQGRLYFHSGPVVSSDPKQETIYELDAASGKVTIAMTLSRGLRTYARYGYDEFAVVGTKIFLAGMTPRSGTELWTLDLATKKAAITRNIASSTADGVGGDDKIKVGERVVFLGKNGRLGPELWTSDGTAAGTKLLFESWPGIRGETYDVGGIAVLNDRLYFFPNPSGAWADVWRSGRLHISDGTPEGTRDLALRDEGDVVYAFPDKGPFRQSMIVRGDKLYFLGSRIVCPSASQCDVYPALYSYDTQTESLDKIGGFGTGTCSLYTKRVTFVVHGSPFDLLGTAGDSFIMATAKDSGCNPDIEPYSYDAGTQTLTLLKDINPTGPSNPH